MGKGEEQVMGLTNQAPTDHKAVVCLPTGKATGQKGGEMIKTAKLGKEIVVTVANKIGVLADLSKIVADYGINIDGVAGYAVDNEARLMLLTNDNLRVVDALKKAGYKSLKEEEVVIIELENKPGALMLVTVNLASQGIDIKHIYGTVCSCEPGCPTKLVLCTSDNKKVLTALA
jgi:hypothetical protein